VVFISHLYKVIFVHIQRTGGNSIQKVFAEHDPQLVTRLSLDPANKRIKHCFAADVQAAVTSDVFRKYTKFCVVRNPYDRMVSWYAMFKHAETIQTVAYEQHPELWTLGREVLSEIVTFIGTDAAFTFENFLRLPREHESRLFERFYLNQVDYLMQQEHLLVDRILTFEHLAHDFADFAERIGFPGMLPHTNQAIREPDYRTYYTDVTKDLIAQRFQRDIDYFGYRF
jgi:hypothetical protein